MSASNHRITRFGVALSNGSDPTSNKRLSGLTNAGGNHGEAAQATPQFHRNGADASDARMDTTMMTSSGSPIPTQRSTAQDRRSLR